MPTLETIRVRKFAAPEGTPWYVREAFAFDVPGAQSDRCLIFDSGIACRRLWHYPEGWAALPVTALLGMIDAPREREHGE